MTEVPPEEEGRGNGRWWLVAILVLLGVLAALSAWLLPQLFEDPPPERVAVPNVIDMKQADAEQAITDAGLEVTVTTRTDEDGRKGIVLEQDPDADTRVDPGTTVTIVVSEGKPQVTVPSVIGLRKNAARRELEALKLDVVLEEKESDVEAGQVIETDPVAGTSVAEGSTVTVYYSDGPEEVPDVVGDPEDVARQKLENAGFTVRVFYDDNPTDQPTGTVLEQTPEAGTTQPAQTQIVLLVTSYVAPTEPPTDTASPTDSPSPSP
jgi:serine/threonine-protein kinase